MKLIISSRAFAEKLKEAFDVGAHVIQYFPSQGTLQFGTTKYQSDVSMPVEKQYAAVSDFCTFNNLGMAKLLMFLKTLSEQPITLTIEEETIRVEHVVIDFV